MIEFRIKQQNIMVGVYLNGDQGNIVLAGGMPQYFDKYHPFVQQVNKLGYNLFIPRYMGTYESDGEFNTQNSVESITSAVRLVKTGHGIELFGNNKVEWNNKNIYVLGFSYGALPALLQKESVNRTLLVCPFVALKYHLEDSQGENIVETFEFLERAYPNVYRFKATKVIEDLSKIELPEIKNDLVIMRGLDDRVIPDEEIDHLKLKYNPLILEKSGKHSISIEDETLKKILSVKE